MAIKFLGLMLFGLLLLCSLEVRETTARKDQDVGEVKSSQRPLHEFHKVVESWDQQETNIAIRRMLRGRRPSKGEVLVHLENRQKVIGKKRKLSSKLSFHKCGHHVKGKLNVECELRDHGAPSNGHFFGHVTFTSDYHTPRTHPHKNN